MSLDPKATLPNLLEGTGAYDNPYRLKGYHPYATTDFANLIVQLAPTLKSLHLASSGYKASSGEFAGAYDTLHTIPHADLQGEPHLGSLGFAVSHCKVLQDLEMDWKASGPGFVEELTKSGELRNLTMCTEPESSALDTLRESFPMTSDELSLRTDA